MDHPAIGAAAPSTTLRIDRKMLRSLAPLPDTAMQLIGLLNDPEVSLRKVADVAVRDVGISASLLRMANSPLFGLRGKVGSISDAIRVIGTAQARLLVLASGVSHIGQREMPLYALGAGAFMKHSELVATLTMTIAHEAGYANIGLAYSAGLLHDLGKAVLNSLAQQQFGRGEVPSLSVVMQSKGCGLTEAELALLGGDHAEVGRQLCELWSLPAELAMTIAGHHLPLEEAQHDLLTYSLILANVAAGVIDAEYPRLSDAGSTQLPEWLNMEKLTMAAGYCGIAVARSA